MYSIITDQLLTFCHAHYLSLFTHISTLSNYLVMGQSVSLIFGQMTLEAEPVSLGWSKDCKVIT